MAYLLIDGFGNDDARDILSEMEKEVHVYSRSVYALHNDAVVEVYGDDDAQHYELFDGYSCYVVSETALNEAEIAATIVADSRYKKACQNWLKQLKADAVV